MESKWKIAGIIPEAMQPKTILVSPAQDLSLAVAAAKTIGYPLFAKPDIGGKGRGVAMLRHEAELEQYHRQVPAEYLLQEKIMLPAELGIFYVRLPQEEQGRITGIVSKEFLSVKGDGIQTVEELISADARLRVYVPALRKTIPAKLAVIPPKGETEILVPYGNHARGATFWDVSHKADAQLNTVINNICRQIPGFYFGRIDLRCDSLASLAAGGAYSIIEVNGAGSEPTHMYDPRNSIFAAWGEIIRHWRWLYLVSRANQQRGVSYLSFGEGMQMMKASSAFEKKMEKFQFLSE